MRTQISVILNEKETKIVRDVKKENEEWDYAKAVKIIILRYGRLEEKLQELKRKTLGG